MSISNKIINLYVVIYSHVLLRSPFWNFKKALKINMWIQRQWRL